jgi:protein TonB
MFHVLLESRSARPRRAGSTVASAVMHGALIAAVIWLARPGSGRALTPPPRDKPLIYVPVRPTLRVDRGSDGRSGEAGRRPVVIPNFRSTNLPPIDLAPIQSLPNDPLLPSGDDFHLPNRSSIVGPGHSGDVIDEHLVDRAPRVIGRPPEPRYPTPLRDAGIQGRVIAEFVVDTLGRAELETLKLDASHALLAESVRAVLPRYRFTPGEASGQRVRTRVQLPFDFALTR